MTSFPFNAADFGAIGDGISKATNALQNAIDACHDAGGGKVLWPAGRYLCGTLFLKSNVELHLESGAVILGSPDVDDYNDENLFPENQAFSSENVTARHLIIAYCQENISITGQGIIDGGSSQFFEPLPAEASATYRHKIRNFPFKEWRPGQMVFFCRCKNVAVRDVKLLNSPYWTLFMLGCEDIQIRGLLIENPPATANGDGIDIDCCKNVTVSDCIIRSGDDSITLRGNVRLLGEGDWICENVVVTNCILSTPCNAIRVGVGDGHVRNCLFNNIVIPEASRGICLVSLYRKTERSKHGTCIEDIHFSDFIINADVPFTVGIGHDSQPPGAIRNISFRNFRVMAWAGSQFVGIPETPIESLVLQNFDWSVCGGTDNTEYQESFPHPISHHGYRARNNTPGLPCAVFATYIKNLSIDNFRLRWEEPSEVWREGILLNNVQNIDLNNLHLRQPQDDNGAAINCQDVQDISLRNNRAASGTSTFIHIANSNKSTFVRYGGNDFSHAATALSQTGKKIDLIPLKDLN
jgi:hypothetical protein